METHESKPGLATAEPSSQGDELLRALVSSQRRTNWVLGLLGLGVATLALGPAGVLAETVSIPHWFSNGAVADADQVNANFTALATEATRVSNIVGGPGDGSPSNRVVDLAAPLAAHDAANKSYVDAAAAGGGGSSLTLVGVTACPSGWDVALQGEFWVSRGDGPGQHACWANVPTQNSSGAPTAVPHVYYSGVWGQVTGWNRMWNEHVSSGYVTPCVICVK